VQNISKITKAMEMIASSKMRKAQERAWQDGLIRKKLSRLLLIWLL
jgi:F0F1-type ATP synthase gamma subunit